MPQILEIIGYVKPVKVFVSDLDKTIQFSWLKETLLIESEVNTLLTISSSSLVFTLSNDYGIDSLAVNGRFHENIHLKFSDFENFFIFQKFIQTGLTIKNPSKFASKLFKALISKLKEKMILN